MHEQVLKSFLIGECTAAELQSDVEGSTEIGRDIFRYHIEPMAEEFDVKSSHLARVCDAVLAGDIDPSSLRIIGFCLVGSDFFEFDADTASGDAVGIVSHWWAAPEINYELNLNNTEMFRDKLLAAESS